MSNESTWYDRCVVRSWAIDLSTRINRYGNTDKIIKDAEKISQFIERRTDAEIVEIKLSPEQENN